MRIVFISRITGFVAAIFILLFSCGKKSEIITTEPLGDYLPVVTGKYITYRVDSLIYTNFGRSSEIHKYQVKHVVDALITDNLGRPSYRVYKYIRDSVNATSWTPAQPWVNAGSYFFTIQDDNIEMIEDNLRIVKLHIPIRDGFHWRGNSHMPDNPYSSKFTFSNDDDIQTWDFTFDGLPDIFTYRGNTYNDVQSVEEEDFTANVPVSDPTDYGSISRSVEKYAKGIGLVYREYTLWEYQPNPGGSGGPYYSGFGLTQWMIDHN